MREVSASLRSPVALGKDPRYVMAQLGHTDPTVTLGIYAQAMTSSDNDRERLRLLVEGRDIARDAPASKQFPPHTERLSRRR